MEAKELNRKIGSSVKWAGITEIVCKIITPLVNMILARLLSPEEFGVVATVTMVTSFADVFVDAGFQKYIIQHDFESEEDLHRSANVAFWTNLIISIFLWLVISLFSEKIAVLVGNPGLGHVIIIVSISLPLTAFSGIQMSMFKKEFDFKSLFWARIIGSLLPVVVTIPLAIIGFSYWALVIGTIATNLVNAVILTLKSKWKPKLFYDVKRLNEMFSFSMWILLESILVWTSAYVGTFVVGRFLSTYYLGIYKNSLTMVNSLMNIIIASTTGVLLSALSIAKNNDVLFKKTFYDFQKKVSFFLIPLGVGVYLFRDLATSILFGDQWEDAGIFVGLYALANAFTILTGQYGSLVFTSKGRPKLAVVSQFLQLIETIPILMWCVNKNYVYLALGFSIARALYGVINMIISRIVFKFTIFNSLKNMIIPVLGSSGMWFVVAIFRPVSASITWQLALVCICIIAYFSIVMLFSDSRKMLYSMLSGIYKTLERSKRNAK